MKGAIVMTREEFETSYREKCWMTVEDFQKLKGRAIPCDCGEPGCRGWQMTFMNCMSEEGSVDGSMNIAGGEG